jgi:hypothetical protein
MQLTAANLRSSGYFIARTHAQCERCSESSRVIALVLPARHDARVDGLWQRAEAHAFIFHIEELPSPVMRRLVQVAPLYTRKHGDGVRNPYWANHCEHCGSMFSDDVLHCEPGGFMPTHPAEAQAITLTHVSEAFSALAAGYSFDPAFLTSMRRC